MLAFLNIVLAAFLAPQKLASNLTSRNAGVERGRGVCELPLAVGNCTRFFPRYYYDSDSGLCFQFTYSGCGGNANRFISKLHCKQRCMRGWTPGQKKLTATFKDPTSMCSDCASENAVCLNGACQCRKGYEMINKKCVDTNECMWNRCPKHLVCRNLPGSFRCECKSGWSENNSNCEQKDLIKSLPLLASTTSSTDTTTSGLQELSITTTEMSFPVACLDVFDERRRRPCMSGDWTRRYYFDHRLKSCRFFWYDKSCGAHQSFQSRNIFTHLNTCLRACEGVNLESQFKVHLTTTSASEPSTIQPFHPHLHKQQQKHHHHHYNKLLPDYHPSIVVEPREVKPTADLVVYPQPTLASLPPIVSEFQQPKSSASKHSLGVVQAMFTVSKTTKQPLIKKGFAEDSTGRSLDESDLQLDSWTNTTYAASSQVKNDICQEPFDPAYRASCNHQNVYVPRYYFDQATQACKMFWFGNCKSKGRNIFDRLESCQWFCGKTRERKISAHCMDLFDENYRKACNRGSWSKRFYFNHKSGRCTSFWYDGCVSASQNIFVEELTCKSLCETSTTSITTIIDAIETETTRQQEIYRCLKPLKIGGCSHRFPAYYYDKEEQQCKPFVYSGCSGNGNRFLSLNQCQSMCHRFNTIRPDEMPCYLPMNAGYGRRNKTCIHKAGYRFYFDSERGKCSFFWHFGCGGNENSFASYEECKKQCHGNSVSKLQQKVRPLLACFQKIDAGQCRSEAKTENVTRYGFDRNSKICNAFEYSNCGGNDNRFETQSECQSFCGSLVMPNSDKCIYQPDWGPCNQLHYMWFYNLTSGFCEQFLFGGCGGNPNRFTSFEQCQVTCEIPSAADDAGICTDKLDRGQWCSPMENHYYYHQKSKSCKGFHYTGCGASRNNFKNLEDCEDVCIHRRRPSSLLIGPDDVSSDPLSVKSSGTKYAGKKPSEKPELEKHVILTEDRQRYVKSDGEWLDYNNCIGFRYNISGAYTRLNSYICLMEEGGTCEIQTLSNTNGEERCYMIKPWLRGMHFYTWFFTVQRRHWRWTPKAKRRQSPQETSASLMILPGVRECDSLC